MFRPAFRAALNAKPITKAASGRRFASTAASRSGSWRGAVVRWGLAGAIVYYYNTSTVLTESPPFIAHAPPETTPQGETYATVDSIAEQRRAQARARSQPPPQTVEPTAATATSTEQAPADALEAEAEQQGAFNEETGEINWDCPCLGGMANGPCGEQFRAAFSCFVFSKEEPKGVDCIDNFKNMQNCFREHPDVYGSELDDEEGPPPEGVESQVTSPPTDSDPQSTKAPATPPVPPSASAPSQPERRERAKAAKAQVERDIGESTSESAAVVPKPWHDGRESTTEK